MWSVGRKAKVGAGADNEAKGKTMAIRFVRIFCWAVLMLALSSALFAQLSVVVSFGPPALPVYVQPPCPAEGYIWTPGYWAYDPNFGDYYRVPGTWH